MAKKTTTAPKKEPTKKAPKAPANPPVEEATVIEQPAAPVINPEVLASSKTSGLDANHQVELLGLMSKHFTGPVAAEKYGAAVEAKMDRIVAVGIVAAIAEHAVTGDSVFAAIMKKEAYPMLVGVAKDMGITLPELKALPAGKEEGTVAIPTDAIKVEEAAAEQIKEEAETEKAGDKGHIELDPVKVAHMSEDDLKKALEYLFITSPKRNKFSVKDTLTSVVDFMREYRMEIARQAQNSTDAMNKYDDRTMYEWLKDIQTYVKPTVITKGIGKGLYALTQIEKGPLGAFLTLRSSLIDKESNTPAWDDQSIADATRFFIEFICEDENAKEEAAIANLNSKDKDYKKIVEAHKNVINRNNEVLAYLNEISFDICEAYNPDGETPEVVLKSFGRIHKQYYPECDMAVPRAKFTGLNENLRQRAGIILNLFRDPGNKHQLYSEANLVEVKEMSLEDWQKYCKAKKEKATAEKKAESKNA